ncbi:MAG: GerMN domain-containing protein [Humibacillus sp.]|nr:GerMN domain-containing protein [Humibacillus sp.]MDN5777877.1 GerMN domain-containing protein [Humibacillus sp.]
MLTLLVALLLCSCSLGVQSSPDLVDVRRSTVSSPGSASASGVPLTIQVYLLHGERLERVARSAAPGIGLAPVLRALGAPIRPDEVSKGLRTALPESASGLSGVVTGSTARITVPPGLDRLSVREQQAAVAQIVFTVTADSLATSVQLVSGNRPVTVPDGDGQLVDRSVTRGDYAALAPPR